MLQLPMKKIMPFILFILVGCAVNTAGYKFSLTAPTISDVLCFEDDKVSWSFQMETSGISSTDSQWNSYPAYEGIGIELTNKTSEMIVIDWNAISVKNPSGHSSTSIMHQEMKYNECASVKAATTIPPKATIKDIIIPCSAVTFVALERGGSYWRRSMLPSPYEHPSAEFGLFVPLQIGSQKKNYDFSFKAVRYHLENGSVSSSTSATVQYDDGPTPNKRGGRERLR
jgi:hypothetical protein